MATQERNPALSYKQLRSDLYHGHSSIKGGAAKILIKFGYRKTVEQALKSSTRMTVAAAKWALKLSAYEIEN